MTTQEQINELMEDETGHLANTLKLINVLQWWLEPDGGDILMKVRLRHTDTFAQQTPTIRLTWWWLKENYNPELRRVKSLVNAIEFAWKNGDCERWTGSICPMRGDHTVTEGEKKPFPLPEGYRGGDLMDTESGKPTHAETITQAVIRLRKAIQSYVDVSVKRSGASLHDRKALRVPLFEASEEQKEAIGELEKLARR